MLQNPWRYDDDDDNEDSAENNKEKKGGGNIAMRLLDARTILVAEEVSDKLYQRVATTLLLLERKDSKAPITVLVNSPGGSADSGFAIYDLFRFSSCPIVTVANGVVASAAVTIYLGATEGRRFALPNARFLLHQPSTFTRGQASDIDITAREILKMRQRYNEVVEQHTGKHRSHVERDADRDFWLSSPEAVEYGLANSILQERKQLDEILKSFKESK